MKAGESFFSLYSHDLVRVAVATPEVRVADPAFNGRRTIDGMQRAARQQAILALFPELGLSAYSCDDLFQQRALLDGCLGALGAILTASQALPLVVVVGMPVEVDHLLYNCAVVISRGRLLGVIPKTYLPNYREFYERRQFTPGDTARRDAIDLLGQADVPFGACLLFRAPAQPRLVFHVEICEDLWVPVPPSSLAALAGATVLLNLSASDVTVGKAEYRRLLVESQSARCLAAYLYAGAGFGESTTDLAWDGHALICENGTRLAESERFRYEDQLTCGDLDLERLTQDRLRQTSFGDAVQRHRADLGRFRTVDVPLELPRLARLLPERRYERFPYVPLDPVHRNERCAEVYRIQVQGLVKRLRATGIRRVVIGVSGGLDSTQALLVCAQAMDALGYPRQSILGYTMPGFASSARTLAQAHALMRVVGCTAHELDIRPSCRQMLLDIGHPHREDHPVYDVTFENVQAGERTSHLFRLANLHGALVVGTSDLSELALGWCTYGVGDHMAHYGVNASVPKTLVQHVIRWLADTERFGPEASAVLRDVLATEISPELVPGVGEGARRAQGTEAVIGPYELQDFNLYYTLRFGYAPSKVAFLSYCAWHDPEAGAWPDAPAGERHGYQIGQIKATLSIFLDRFFRSSQFKRSAMPNAPKVGSGGSLSPRGDYRAPSDATATAWLHALELVPDVE
jgi:NAD+ synthase (glutamine-hydrolysing)